MLEGFIGILLIVANLLPIIFGWPVLIGVIVLLFQSINAKKELKLNNVDDGKIRKITNIAIWSLVVSILSCMGSAFFIFPVLALVFANVHAKKALLQQDIVAATAKSNLALTMLIISNSIVLASICITFIYGMVSAFILQC